MSIFITVRNIDHINEMNFSNDWKDAESFPGKNRIVGPNGEKITSSYKGKQYQVIGQKERNFTREEKICRKILAIVVVIFTLGIAIFFQSVRNLLTQEKAKIRFAVAAPPIEKELNKGIDISEEMVKKIHNCMRYILQRQEEKGMKLYTSRETHRIFSFGRFPRLIFKMDLSPSNTIERYKKMIDVTNACRIYALDRLRIPRAKLLPVEYQRKRYEIIAEEKLDINPTESVQEELFLKHAASLDDAIRQLAFLIACTGLSDIELRNNPILLPRNSPMSNGSPQPKIALLDLEEMDGPETGLFGRIWAPRRGLVRCVNERQGKIIEEVARKCGISTKKFAAAHQWRKEELAEMQNLKNFYLKNKITTGKEPITVDVEALQFTEYPNAKVKLKQVAKMLVKKINEKIAAKQADDLPPKGRRCIWIEELDELSPRIPGSNEDADNGTYIGYILNKFQSIGVIFKRIKTIANKYYIQA